MTRFAAPISEYIWDMKYRFKDAHGKNIDETVEDTWSRIAKDLASCEATQVQESFEKQFYDALNDWKYLPAGRITAGAGTGRNVTLFNCFVMGTIPDSMDGIFSMLREAALTMQQGGGIGYDFSTLRPKNAPVLGVAADASGPLTFMDVWDSMCRTVMSAGSRRGAMMATMRCDHPDILDFIHAKKQADRLRMFNLSVLITDAFMAALKAGEDWDLKFTDQHGETTVYKTIPAVDLWDAIMTSTYNQAEPGVIFIDRINAKNNLSYCETIASTNPCGEQPLPPYGACLLGSINLAKLIKNAFETDSYLDEEALRKTVATAVRMMDNVVNVSKFPLEAQAQEAKTKRRIGLGVTGLADALIMIGQTYGSPEAVATTSRWMKYIAYASYWASVELAKEKGSFPLFDADEFLKEGTHVWDLCQEDPELEEAIRKHGIRNALLTSIAPTGTISLYAGNVSSGIEPVFAYEYTRKVLQKDGTRTEELVQDYAVMKYWEWMGEHGSQHPDDLPHYFVSAQTLDPMSHVRMQAAAQKWVDSSISKTINCPEDIPYEEFKDVYMEAWDSGCKGCTTYRPNDITGSVLSVEPEKDAKKDLEKLVEKARGGVLMTEEESTEEMFVGHPDDLPDRPEELEGSTYKIKVGDQKAVYLTINDTFESNGTFRPFEIFLRSSDPAHDEWMVTVARLVSAIMRRPHDASFIGPELMRVHSTITGGFQRGKGHQPSLVAAIGRKIKEHAERGSFVFSSEVVCDVGLSEFGELAKNKPCQSCHSYNTKLESGCLTCLDCGDSKCG